MSDAAKRAFVVAADDDRDIVELVAIVLGRAGFEVITAEDGAQALSLILDGVPDVCILDGVMPGMAGFEILKAIRADERAAGVRVLILTATVDEQREIRRHGVEPDAFMSKPFESEALIAAIEGLLD